MNKLDQPKGDVLLPNPIRVETALSRYPIHRLAKQGNITIGIRQESDDGEVLIRWDVDYSEKRGQPGPLAYKLDTLVINRRIEEAPRPIPRLIRLGSLSDICRELGMVESGRTKNDIKNSLHQNASAYINAKIKYKTSTGTERDIEFGDTRYGIVFTGETLPDGRKADAVYIVLHDFYREILDKSVARPLDYEYLKSLPPAAQRFYELLSFQVYAALKHGRPRARILYSELCRFAPLARQSDWNVVRPQLTRIHAPHLKAGYLARFDHEPTTDGADRPDWVLYYTPGPRAHAEFQAFTRRGGPAPRADAPDADGSAPPRLLPAPPPPPTEPVPPPAPAPAPAASPQEAALIAQGVTPAIARRLVATHGADAVRTQLEVLAWHAATDPAKITDPAAWLVTAILHGHPLPAGLGAARERRRREADRQTRLHEEAATRQRERDAAARKRAEHQAINAYWEALTPGERAALDVAAWAQASPEEAAMEGRPRTLMRNALREQLIRTRLRASGAFAVASVEY